MPGQGFQKPREITSTSRGCMSAFNVTVHDHPPDIWSCPGIGSLSVLCYCGISELKDLGIRCAQSALLIGLWEHTPCRGGSFPAIKELADMALGAVKSMASFDQPRIAAWKMPYRPACLPCESGLAVGPRLTSRTHHRPREKTQHVRVSMQIFRDQATLVRSIP